jgi:hypothetical protein
MDTFKNKSLKNRKLEYNKIKSKYPNKIPIIVNISKNSRNIILNKNKYLCEKDTNMSILINIIRKNIDIDKSNALFFTINNNLYNSQVSIGEIYKSNKNEDGFLYIVCSCENTFG